MSADRIESYQHQDLTLALPVPDGTTAHNPLVVNELLLYPLNDKTTQALLDKGTNVSCPVGTSSCIVRGKSLLVRLPIVGVINALDKVYKAGDGTYTGTATNNTHIGWATASQTVDGVIETILR